MICISSGAGVRLAKARDAMDRLGVMASHRVYPSDSPEVIRAVAEYRDACAEVSAELIADNYHLMTGP